MSNVSYFLKKPKRTLDLHDKIEKIHYLYKRHKNNHGTNETLEYNKLNDFGTDLIIS